MVSRVESSKVKVEVRIHTLETTVVRYSPVGKQKANIIRLTPWMIKENIGQGNGIFRLLFGKNESYGT